ncbi:MAG: phosphoribosylglycinamide formyltransferase [Planctomycetes bacterium]|nr:phosphoribosylglycinamide formyltransferase [Planctomycetota bacterium]
MTRRLRVAVLLSGSGRTFDNLLAQSRAGVLPIDIAGVVSSRGDVAGVVKARASGIATVVLRRKSFADAAGYGHAIGELLDRFNVDLAVMAGFLHLWSVPARFDGRVMNIHPALLPAFGGPGMHGDHVHAAVLESGAKVSGCTVHFANDAYDRGPIILQRTVPVAFEDTAELLAARVFAQECVAYPEAIALFAAGRLEIVGQRVRIAAANP